MEFNCLSLFICTSFYTLNFRTRLVYLNLELILIYITRFHIVFKSKDEKTLIRYVINVIPRCPAIYEKYV